MKRIFGNGMDDIDREDDDQKNPMLGGDNSASPAEKEMDEILSSIEKTALKFIFETVEDMDKALEILGEYQDIAGYEVEDIYSRVMDFSDQENFDKAKFHLEDAGLRFSVASKKTAGAWVCPEGHKPDEMIEMDVEGEKTTICPICNSKCHWDPDVVSKKTADEGDDELPPALDLKDVVEAIEDERKGVEEYELLSDRAPDSETAQVLDEMADDERRHREQLEQIILPAVIPSQPQDTEVPTVQTAPEEVPAEGKPPLLPGEAVAMTPDLRAKIASYVSDELVPHLQEAVERIEALEEGDALATDLMRDKNRMADHLSDLGYGDDSDYLTSLSDADWNYFLDNFPIVENTWLETVEFAKKKTALKFYLADKVRVIDPDSPHYDEQGEVASLDHLGEKVVVMFADGRRKEFHPDDLDKVASKKTAQDDEIEVGETVAVDVSSHPKYMEQGEVTSIDLRTDSHVVRFADGSDEIFPRSYIKKVSSKKTAQVPEFSIGEPIQFEYPDSPGEFKDAKIVGIEGYDSLADDYLYLIRWEEDGQEVEGQYHGNELSKKGSKKTAQEMYYEGETVKVSESSSPHFGQMGQIVFISPESGSLTLEFPDGSRETFSDAQTEKLAKGITGEKKTAQLPFNSPQEVGDLVFISYQLDLTPQESEELYSHLKSLEDTVSNYDEEIGRWLTEKGKRGRKIAQVNTQQLNDILQRDFEITLPELSQRMKDLMQFVEERMSQFGETVDDAVGQWVDKTDSGNLVVGRME